MKTRVIYRGPELDGVKDCDFCSKPWPEWKYLCDPVCVSLMAHSETTTQRETIEYDPEWYACSDCKKLIDANNRKGLARRYIERKYGDISALERTDRNAVMETVLLLHAEFFKARRGDPIETHWMLQ